MDSRVKNIPFVTNYKFVDIRKVFSLFSIPMFKRQYNLYASMSKLKRFDLILLMFVLLNPLAVTVENGTTFISNIFVTILIQLVLSKIWSTSSTDLVTWNMT